MALSIKNDYFVDRQVFGKSQNIIWLEIEVSISIFQKNRYSVNPPLCRIQVLVLNKPNKWHHTPHYEIITEDKEQTIFSLNWVIPHQFHLKLLRLYSP